MFFLTLVPFFTSRPTSTFRRVNTFGGPTRAQASGTNLELFTSSCSGAYGNAYILAGVAPRAKTDFNKVNGTANGTVLHPVTEDIVPSSTDDCEDGADRSRDQQH